MRSVKALRGKLRKIGGLSASRNVRDSKILHTPLYRDHVFPERRLDRLKVWQGKGAARRERRVRRFCLNSECDNVTDVLPSPPKLVPSNANKGVF